MAMRVLIAMTLATALSAPAPAQQMDDAHNNLFADHASGGNNGAARIGARIGGAPSAQAPRPVAPLAQPANSGIQMYQPRSLNDVARDWAKAHPRELPNRRKPEPQ